MLKTHLEAFRRRYAHQKCLHEGLEINLYNINMNTDRIQTCRQHIVSGRGQVCVPPEAVADRGDGNQQPPESSERQTVSAAQDRLSARRPS